MGTWYMDTDEIMVVYPVYTYNDSRLCNAPRGVEMAQEYTGPVKG